MLRIKKQCPGVLRMPSEDVGMAPDFECAPVSRFVLRIEIVSRFVRVPVCALVVGFHTQNRFSSIGNSEAPVGAAWNSQGRKPLELSAKKHLEPWKGVTV
ncbi:hypothetical protein C5Y93_29050 [Blastopirellula marina]|uniref:Uncharacterized protein n=1 Tax=Blastopirellula marina TaxID=124 RepID=A0A2S8GD80_9BACT|nr:hypothetical protein C5Y93_29050 [Blastopirellula marina]